MKPDKVVIQNYFSKLGLDADIAAMYLALHEFGPQTISELSRNSKVERTRVYRLIDQLLESSLIEVESQYKRGVLKAAPIANLNILISRKEQELKNLQDELGMIEQVLARNSLSSPASRVQFYYGPEGVKQMLWNETNAKSEVLGILYENIQIRTKSRFFERWVRTCNEKQISFKGIISEPFLSSHDAWYSQHQNERIRHWQGRYIAPDTFPITHSTITYDDVTLYFNWKDDEIFGIEIYNKEIAETQARLFAILWEKATPLTQ